MRNNERESCETFFNVGKICQKLHFAAVEGCLFDDDDDDNDDDDDDDDDDDYVGGCGDDGEDDYRTVKCMLKLYLLT